MGCFLVCFAVLQQLILAIAGSNVYVVYMGDNKNEEPHLTEELHHAILTSALGSKEAAMSSILYSYKHSFSGFAAVLTKSEAKLIADFPGVVRVMPNRVLNLHTTRSWDFLQLKLHLEDGLLSTSRLGNGSIIGVLDTGIWPELENFKDDNMGEVPSQWKGICQEGDQFNSSHCNRKIIGARWYIKGYNAEFGELNTNDTFEFLSPRDAVGHGTHTSSTAAGAFIGNASLMGLAQGLARGGAPHARLAIYKVCWATGGCSSADLLAAFDDAIFDGVDVLSVSLGSAPPLATYVEDAVSVGSFHAVANGITVVCSAGNFGPLSQTVSNSAPWIITVAADTIDRAFPTTITLGNNQTFVGQALYMGKNAGKFYDMVYSEDIASSGVDDDKARSCEAGSLNATLAKGKVIVCFESRSQRSVVVAMRTVTKARGVGLIFAQFPTKDVFSSLRIPCVQVDFEIATAIIAYIENTRNPLVRFGLTKTVLGALIAPEVAFFSSRGPSSLSPSVLKPDIAAPGVNILAAWPPASLSSSPEVGHNQMPLNFKIESGTSMACPHISGIVALLKSINPSWSPAAIKSALVTTASIKDEYSQNLVAEGAPHKQADPFDYGGGHIDPNKAMNPGLIYDMEMADHIRFLCSLGYNNSAISLMTRKPTICSRKSRLQADLNLPSISITGLRNSATVTRTVTNVSPISSLYIAHVKPPPGVRVRVEPSVLSFNTTARKLSFNVIFQTHLRVQGRYSFGSLTWRDGVHVVRIPLAVRTVIDDFYADI